MDMAKLRKTVEAEFAAKQSKAVTKAETAFQEEHDEGQQKLIVTVLWL
jgi:hypothetical protein